MSADLFAEFANDAPSQPSASSTAAGGRKPPASTGPFDFGLTNNTSTTASDSPVERWPSIQTYGSGMSTWGAAPTTTPTIPPLKASNDDDDGWGDFETAKQDSAQPQLSSKAIEASSGPFGGFPGGLKSQEIKNRPARAPTLDLMTNTLIDTGTTQEPGIDSSWDLPPKKLKARMVSAAKDPSVLFDVDDFELQEAEAGDDEDDDEFGDFETVSPMPSQPKPKPAPVVTPAPSSHAAPLLDLLSLDDSSQQPPQQYSESEKQPAAQLQGALSFGAQASTFSSPPKSPSLMERSPFPDLAIKTTSAAKSRHEDQRSPSPVTAWPKIDSSSKPSTGWKDDDDWGAWDDMASGDNQAKRDIDNTESAASWDWNADGESESAAIHGSDNDPPPINVPPPSVILSAFPDLFSSGAQFFRPMSGQNASIKQQVLSDPKAVLFLQAYILLATTAARVIAGRKHRWHRDKILAKSMSISAAGSKGMKLVGVDKTQSAREDREAADVAAAWREQVGRLRSAVAAAKTAGKTNLRVPELSENLQVQTAKMVPTSAKPCIICGLKREERVTKVDYDVEDSFGEWWVEHWGHRACKNFWVEHEQKLRQR